jgi:DNA-binding NarL/FixJ family response regulator
MLASYSASDGSTALASISTGRERAMARSRAAAKSRPVSCETQMRTSIDREEKPELLNIDTKKLRQAGIARLLQAWADVMGFTVNAVLPDALPDSNNYAMTIVNLGDTSIEEAQCHVLLENVRRLMSNASLIIISDREDLHEVCAAFHQGARGFMPTTIEPRLAFQALSFIDGGGTFFSPRPVLF